MPSNKANPSNQPNREELMQMATTAISKGQKQAARVMLQRILSEDKENIRAMMYMAKISRSSKERRAWLNRVLDVDVNHETAIKTLDKMDYQDAVKRNRMFLRIGVGAYVSVVVVVAAVILIVVASQPPI